MRGSPLLRFLFLTLALAVAAAGLYRLTAARAASSAAEETISKPAITPDSTAVPFYLTLSEPAGFVEIDTGSVIRPEVAGNPISGSLVLDPADPHLSLLVRWKQPATAGGHRFAKLTLERPGQATFTHVFDSRGDISDFLELPLPE